MRNAITSKRTAMLQLKDFYPIDIDYVRVQWNKIMNIPNSQWEILGVERSIEIINDQDYPGTLRTSKLNMLPALVIEIIRNRH